MINSNVLFHEIRNKITLQDNEDEIRSMIFFLMQHVFGCTKTDILAGKSIMHDEEQLEKMIKRLNDHEPIQYVLNTAYFLNREFYVDHRVLIPRPETEELVQLVLASLNTTQHRARIVDIGTGSGCIAVTLALESRAQVFAYDVSEDALAVASLNNKQLQASVNFRQLDILNENDIEHDLDVVVSNPPYVAWKEKDLMQINVIDYEPGLALFVSDDDPLIFYRVITRHASYALKKGGMLAFEINPLFADDLVSLIQGYSFHRVDVHKDMFGKKRFILAWK